MIFERSKIYDVITMTPETIEDSRGTFFEAFREKGLSSFIGQSIKFVQDNQSVSNLHVLRGLHYQEKLPQAKLIRVVQGEIFDVAVDLRKNSPDFGKWVGHYLSEDNRKQVFIPKGFAHGFLSLSAQSSVVYKVSDYYDPYDQKTILWNDKTLNIEWPCSTIPILSDKDKGGSEFDTIQF
jgi:dTDP-4-dehydrorhamnose 3,5-epimerase